MVLFNPHGRRGVMEEDCEAWLERILDTIERLEKRAAAGETFALLALPGWRAELERVKKGGGKEN